MKKKSSNLPRYKSGLGNQWKYLSSPGPYYYGGAIHYLNKSGKYVHDNKIRDIKPYIMTKTEFNKKFGHLLKDKEYMGFLKGINAIV